MYAVLIAVYMPVSESIHFSKRERGEEDVRKFDLCGSGLFVDGRPREELRVTPKRGAQNDPRYLETRVPKAHCE